MSILWLGDPACHDVSLVGGKVANLSRLAAAHPVPAGFCLTTQAYSQWSDAGDQEDRSRSALYDRLVEAYQALAERCGSIEPSVAVRSSAIDEDGRAASFAGQYETYLNIIGAQAVAEAVQRCWKSLSSPRVMEYRKQYGLPTAHVGLAVLVQHLVAADVSAVVFSANPVTRNRDEVVINASWGLGESVVGGTVTPDTYVVRKTDLMVTDRRIAEKRRMTVSVPGGTREVDVPRFLRAQPTLDDGQILEMARMVMRLEDVMGWPVDVECACHEGRLYLLQCRHITTLIEPE